MILLLLSILLVSLKGDTYDLGTSSLTAWTKQGTDHGTFEISNDASECSNDACIYVRSKTSRGDAYIEQEVDLSGMLNPTINFAVTTVAMENNDNEHAFFKYKCENDPIFDTTEINKGVEAKTDYSNSIDLDVDCHVVTIQIGGNIGGGTGDHIYIKQVEIDYTCGVCYDELDSIVDANSDVISTLQSDVQQITANSDSITTNTDSITTNTDSISTCQGDISSNAAAIADLDARVTNYNIQSFELDCTTLNGWTKSSGSNEIKVVTGSGCGDFEGIGCIRLNSVSNRNNVYVEQTIDLTHRSDAIISYSMATLRMEGQTADDYGYIEYQCDGDAFITDPLDPTKPDTEDLDNYDKVLDLSNTQCNILTIRFGGYIGGGTDDFIYVKAVKVSYDEQDADESRQQAAIDVNVASISNINSQIGDLNARIDDLVSQLNVISAAHTNGINGFDYNNLGGIDTDKYTLSNLIMVGLVAVVMTAFICQCMYWNFAKRNVKYAPIEVDNI